MKIVNYDFPKLITKTKPMVLYVFGDTHMGNQGFNETLLKKHIGRCRKEKASWIHLGDWVEAINPKDKRFDVRVVENPIINQYEEITKLFEPIKERGLVILSGNHDEKISKDYGDFVAQIGRRLDVFYMGYDGILNLRFWHQTDKKNPNYSFKIFLHHGQGGGRKVGSKANNLQALSHMVEADAYIIGHTHIYFHHIDNLITVIGDRRNKSRFVMKQRHYISIPAYLEGYMDTETSSYVEKAAYLPQATGCVRIELYRKDDGIDIKVEPLV